MATEKPVGFLFGSNFALVAEKISAPISYFIPPLSWIKAEYMWPWSIAIPKSSFSFLKGGEEIFDG